MTAATHNMRLPADWVVPLPRGMSCSTPWRSVPAGFTGRSRGGAYGARGPQTRQRAGDRYWSHRRGGRYRYRYPGWRGLSTWSRSPARRRRATTSRGSARKRSTLRSSLDLARIKPLDKATWAGAVDNLGGEVLAWLASTMNIGGTLASIGLAASHTRSTLLSCRSSCAE